MGVNICVQTLEQARNQEKELFHPDWDLVRQANDRDFARLLDDLPKHTVIVEGELYYRPSDFAAWRDAIEHSCYPEKSRYHRLLDILDRDKDQYIFLSW